MHIWYGIGMVIFYLHNIIENILTKHKKIYRRRIQNVRRQHIEYL